MVIISHETERERLLARDKFLCQDGHFFFKKKLYVNQVFVVTLITKHKLLFQEPDGLRTNNGVHYRLSLYYPASKKIDYFYLINKMIQIPIMFFFLV